MSAAEPYHAQLVIEAIGLPNNPVIGEKNFGPMSKPILVELCLNFGKVLAGVPRLDIVEIYHWGLVLGVIGVRKRRPQELLNAGVGLVVTKHH